MWHQWNSQMTTHYLMSIIVISSIRTLSNEDDLLDFAFGVWIQLLWFVAQQHPSHSGLLSKPRLKQ